MSGKFFVVATPIGNLSDITERAKSTLSSVDVIFAEDTRVIRKLLTSFKINTEVDSYHAHSSHEKKLAILNRLLNGENIALVTDAGTPGISDPGNELLNFLYDSLDDFTPIPVPGPSAVVTALSVSGFDTNNFVFLGFMPKKKKNKLIKSLAKLEMAFCFYDSPHRVLKSLQTLEKELGDARRVFVGRELTKIHETHYRGSLPQVIKLLQEEPNLKGELVVVVEGSK